MPISRHERSQHWRALAAEALAKAADVIDPQVRATLISIAVLYDDLAIKAELNNRPLATRPQPIRPKQRSRISRRVLPPVM
jgi:hypothetical protein